MAIQHSVLVGLTLLSIFPYAINSQACSPEEDRRLQKQCVNPANGIVCSRRGECVCGTCECHARRLNSAEWYSGRYCHCDDYSCDFHNYRMCGGHGECHCGTCRCHEGWQGEICECPLSKETCRTRVDGDAPESGRSKTLNDIYKINSLSPEEQAYEISEHEEVCSERMDPIFEYDYSTQAPDTANYCSVTWDGIMCWEAVPAGTIAKQPCPDYIDKFNRAAYATRECQLNGTWKSNPEKPDGWTNYTQCLLPDNVGPDLSICNGVGTCSCGVCKCFSSMYFGPTCQECPTCPSLCKDLRECALCALDERECNHTCPRYEVIASMGTDPDHGTAHTVIRRGSAVIVSTKTDPDHAKEEHTRHCSTHDTDGCKVRYSYRYPYDGSFMLLEVLNVRDCDSSAVRHQQRTFGILLTGLCAAFLAVFV